MIIGILAEYEGHLHMTMHRCRYIEDSLVVVKEEDKGTVEKTGQHYKLCEYLWQPVEEYGNDRLKLCEGCEDKYVEHSKSVPTRAAAASPGLLAHC